MATRQPKAKKGTGRSSPEGSAAASAPAWRQPPPEPRAKVRRQQLAVKQVEAARGNPLAPVLARALELRHALTLRHMLALLVVAAIALGVSQALTHPRFTVTATNVQVRGNQRISIEEIYGASQLEGSNIFQVRTEGVAGRIGHLPGVESVDVHLRLPAEAIIDVTELAPLAVVQTITETLWIGSNGKGIQQTGEAPTLTLVEVNGTVRDARGVVVPEMVRALEAIRTSRPDLTALYYGTLEGLYFRAPEGYTVYLGEGGAMARKLALLEATQQQVAERGVRPQAIDLRFDGYAMLK